MSIHRYTCVYVYIDVYKYRHSNCPLLTVTTPLVDSDVVSPFSPHIFFNPSLLVIFCCQGGGLVWLGSCTLHYTIHNTCIHSPVDTLILHIHTPHIFIH